MRNRARKREKKRVCVCVHMLMFAWACECVSVCMCVCVCAREREREREKFEDCHNSNATDKQPPDLERHLLTILLQIFSGIQRRSSFKIFVNILNAICQTLASNTATVISYS